jgi:hypothetical protein
MNRQLHTVANLAFSRICLLCILILPTIIIPSIAQAQSLPAATITFGTTTSGSISTPGEIDTYTFSANTGDMILIGMSRVSGSLWQRLRLYDPDGKLLRDISSPVHVEISQILPDRFYVFLPLITKDSVGGAGAASSEVPAIRITATIPGTYTILASDGFDGTLTGSYNIFLQKLNPPASATAVSFSQTVAGAINQPAEMDAFTFPANANDKVIIGMSRVSGNLWQKIRLYDPSGTLLNENSSPVHAEMAYPIPVTGTYAILVGDGFDGTLTGSYNIFVQRTNNPANATAISFGQTQPGSINLPAEMDAFTFSGNANANIQVTMTRVSGSLWQQIRIYDPSGNLLGENSAPTQAQLTRSLPATGIYTILASDGFDGTLTGNFNVTLQQLP